MPVNLYFNNFSLQSEQNLIEDLVIESIRMYGIDVYFLPRTIVHRNEVFREQEMASFLSHFQIEMYIKNINSFAGDGKFLSRFGLEIRDEITFTVAQNVFRKLVDNQDRPNEGDLIWFPLNNKVFQIKFVNHESIFYQLGALQVYDLTCELFEFSNEVFQTGLPVIDDRYNALTTSMEQFEIESTNDFIITDGANNNIVIQAEYDLDKIDNNAQNDTFNSEIANVVDFSTNDPFSEGRY